MYIGIAEGHADPAVAAVRNGSVIAFAEEERFTRAKHALGAYPIRALKYCLETARVSLSDVAAVCVGWDLDHYTDGTVSEYFEQMRQHWPVDSSTKLWQKETVRRFSHRNLTVRHHRQWRRHFGTVEFPQIKAAPHHFTHAFQASMQSPFESCLVLTVDGSGDTDTTVLWFKNGSALEKLREIRMPHSLGWFYAAFTEYLGFDAYDGEYKVMGLAAHGSPRPGLRKKVGEVLFAAHDGVEFRMNPAFIHYGEHSWSGRFTDALPELFGREPRLPSHTITDWHKDLSYAVQEALEEAASRLVAWGIKETGARALCVGGGVGLNVKMNTELLRLSGVEDVFAHPLCADSGAAAGVALAVCERETGIAPEQLTTLALGPGYSEQEIKDVLDSCRVDFDRPASIDETIAHDLAAGRIVGWFQGRMEAGPRALGQRSILADPRSIAVRDTVNNAVKQREPWRPFGPAILAEARERYFDEAVDSRYMTLAFVANRRLVDHAPAIVHSDGTVRVQFVHQESSPELHSLLTTFNALTGVPVVLNTSFNIRGEPIVCSPQDALRTFWATGLDVLAIGPYVVRKPLEVGISPKTFRPPNDLGGWIWPSLIV